MFNRLLVTCSYWVGLEGIVVQNIMQIDMSYYGGGAWEGA